MKGRDETGCNDRLRQLRHKHLYRRVKGEAVLMVGDATWDCARRAGATAVAVLSGGIGRAELEQAGATAVFAPLDALREALDGLLARR